MTGKPSRNGEEEPADEIIAVADTTAEFVERERYRTLYESRKYAGERIRDASIARRGARKTDNADGVEGANTQAREAVQAYVIEAEDLFRRTDYGKRLWKQKVLGPVSALRFIPPADRQGTITGLELINKPSQVEISGAGPDQQKVALRGVEGFVNFSEPFARVSSKVELPRSGSPTKTVENRVELETPIELSRAAYRSTNELLAEIGVLGELGGKDYRADEPGA